MTTLVQAQPWGPMGSPESHRSRKMWNTWRPWSSLARCRRSDGENGPGKFVFSLGKIWKVSIIFHIVNMDLWIYFCMAILS